LISIAHSNKLAVKFNQLTIKQPILWSTYNRMYQLQFDNKYTGREIRTRTLSRECRIVQVTSQYPYLITTQEDDLNPPTIIQRREGEASTKVPSACTVQAKNIHTIALNSQKTLINT